ncbi:MFS transporter [Amycolatopsis nigrescens]|uniref:MFS transporter n=1 Tax=Amycolatopsis nigrescens TaxID=381445 RepID=UPI000367E2D5|nr:MFS transporter [Amycolatopsis nigrescens]
MARVISDGSLRASTMRRVTRRVVPLLMLGYIVSYIDRINISFAKFGLEETFGMSATQYGFAAGIFFVGYVLAEVPSNMIMAKVGARIWLSRIMVTWGVIAALLAFAPNVEMVYVLRFLLGIAEAGFFPGILVYLTHWFPNSERTKVISTVMVAIPLAGVIGGPLNGWILSAFDDVAGLDGWRWIFLVGGIPAVVLGVVFFLTVTERPADARWLGEAQREWLITTLATEEAERTATAPAGHRAVFRNKKVLALTAVYFLLQCGAYPLIYWMPSVIKDVGATLNSVQVGWLSAVPFLMAAICMYLAGRLVRDERSSKPVLIALGVSVVAFAVTAVGLGTPALAFFAITVATMAAQTAKPLFWSLPTAFLAGVGAASGIALINSLGNAAGFISPFAVGWIQDISGGNAGLSMTVMILANILAMAVIGGLWLSARRRRTALEPAIPDAPDRPSGR